MARRRGFHWLDNALTAASSAFRVPTKPAMHSNLKPAGYSDRKPAPLASIAWVDLMMSLRDEKVKDRLIWSGLLLLSEAVSFEFNAVGVVDAAIEGCVGDDPRAYHDRLLWAYVYGRRQKDPSRCRPIYFIKLINLR